MEHAFALDAMPLNETLHDVLFNLAKALTPFMQRDSYLWWPYIASSIVIALCAWRFLGAAGPSPRPWRDFWREYFGPQVWWHRSAQADYWLYLANALILPAILAIALVNERQFAGLLGLQDGPPTIESTSVAVRALFTIAFFVAYDFGRFVMHCLLHDVPVLWEFHKIHHSAEVLTPMTTYRAHPVELLLMAWGPIIATGLVVFAFNTIAPGTISLYYFLGWHVIFFGFNLVDNLRHSPVWLSYGPLVGRWLISPAHHQVHHSCEAQHLGCNRGFELAIWDRLYGTLYVPRVEPERFRTGLGDGTEARYHKLLSMYCLPFARAGHQFAKLARRSLSRPFAR
jgi:sterol desaturase/sphingolipid hydroxylase (fatty acid hydroxylase superfamily)